MLSPYLESSSRMSNLPPLVSIAVRCSIHAPISGDNVGSTCTSWHTSDKSFAVRSLIPLRQMLKNPSFFQDILCWIVNGDPQTHVAGKFAFGQPHRNLILSQSCCFVRSNQFDTPFFRFISFSLFLSFVNASSKLCKKFLYRSSFSAFILLFSFETLDVLTEYVRSWLMMKLVSCLVIILNSNCHIQISQCHERMVYLIRRTVLVMITGLFHCRNKCDHLW